MLPLSLEGDKIFGELKKEYRENIGISKQAIKRHNSDFILASTAINENAVLVSNDKIFNEFKKLRDDFQLDDWAA